MEGDSSRCFTSKSCPLDEHLPDRLQLQFKLLNTIILKNCLGFARETSGCDTVIQETDHAPRLWAGAGPEGPCFPPTPTPRTFFCSG